MIKFIEGAQGHLFLTNDTNGVLAQITGQYQAPDAFLSDAARFHEGIDARMTAASRKYAHIIAPNKETALRDLLPPGYAYLQYGPTPVRKYLGQCPDVARFTFFDDNLLLPGRNSFPTYDRQDTHWNPKGARAYLGAAVQTFEWNEVAEALRLLDVETRVEGIVGDLGVHSGRGPEQVERLYPRAPGASIVFEGDIANEGYVRYCRSSKGKGRAIFFHDSFVHALFRLVSELFEETLFLHTHEFLNDIVEHFRPDYVVRLQAERFFTRMPEEKASCVAWAQGLEQAKAKSNKTSTFLGSLIQE